MARRLTAGIDSGTQSTKILLVDEDGTVVGRGQAPHEMVPGLAEGASEQDPATWTAALTGAFKQAAAEANAQPAEIVAIGVSGQQHGFVPLDENGRVIRPAKLWNDTSTDAETRALVAAAGGDQVYFDAIGQSLAVGFTASKILWLKEHEPENFARLRHVLLPHDYLNYWLTGVPTMEWGDASGTGLMDVRSRAWRPEIAGCIDPKVMDCLPPLRPSGEPAGEVQPSAAEALGIAPGALVSAGGGDNMMGAIGSGNVRPGVMTVSLGTSGTIYGYSDKPITDPQGEIAAFCDSTGGWLPLLCTMNVTAAVEIVKGLLGLDTAAFNDAAASAPAGCAGLLLVPYFNGERVPAVPDGAGVWFGATPHNSTPAHTARATMEGATLGLGYGLGRLRELGMSSDEIRITGGGANSDLWRQICADAFGAPVVRTTEPEGAALGAAIQARAAWLARNGGGSLHSVVDAWVALDPASRCEPDAGRAALYAELQDLHDGVSTALRPQFTVRRTLIRKHQSAGTE